MKLIFVYNADSGKLNTMFDIAHKIVSPKTYKCSLCSITHNALSEKSEWSEFRKQSKVSLEFLHKDEFENKYKVAFDYPVILQEKDGLNLQLSAKEISEIKSTQELIAKINNLSS